MKTTVDATIGTIPVRQFMAKFPVQMPGSYRTSRMVQICLKKRNNSRELLERGG